MTNNDKEAEARSRMQMEWLRRLQGNQSERAAADEIGISDRSFNNWVRRRRIPAESVLKIAGNLGLDPVRALIQTGYWDKSLDQNRSDMDASLEYAPMSALTDELVRRVDTDAGKMLKAILSPFSEK